MKAEDLPDTIKRLNPNLFCVDGAVMPGVEESVPVVSKADVEAEKVLQDRCESYLRLHGYYPRTPSFILDGESKNGYYVHLNKTKRNPIMLDITIIDMHGNCLQVELKTVIGTVTKEQAQIIQEDDGALVVRDFESFVAAFAIWESTKKNGKDQDNDRK